MTNGGVCHKPSTIMDVVQKLGCLLAEPNPQQTIAPLWLTRFGAPTA